MQIKPHLIRLIKCHYLAYERLLKAIDPIDDSTYYKDHGLYFKSLHGTLNHLLLVDLLWFYRLRSERPPIEVTGLDQQLYSDRKELSQALIDNAQKLVEFVHGQSEEFFEHSLRVKTISGSELIHQAYWLVATIANHGTHHRGQITAILNQLEIQYQPMDLPFFPEM